VAEHLVANQKTVGSNPTTRSIICPFGGNGQHTCLVSRKFEFDSRKGLHEEAKVSEGITTAEELRPVYWRLRSRPYRPWANRHGRKTDGCYGTYRHPRTTNERRQAEKSWKSQSKRKRQYNIKAL
jgi:hypothetical protein